MNARQKGKLKKKKQQLQQQPASKPIPAAVPAPLPLPVPKRAGGERSKFKELVYAPPPKTLESDDEFFVLAKTLKQNHRLFAEAIMAGEKVTDACIASGYTGLYPRQQGAVLIRRPDVLRYIHLGQARIAGACVVTVAAMADRLWSIVTDPKVSDRQKDLAWGHLIRLKSAEARVIPPGEKGFDAKSDPPSVDPSLEVGMVLADYKARKGEETP